VLINHAFPFTKVVSNVCIEVSQEIVGCFALTHLRASLVSSTKSGYCAVEFGLYTCIKHMERPNNFNPNIQSFLSL